MKFRALFINFQIKKLLHIVKVFYLSAYSSFTFLSLCKSISIFPSNTDTASPTGANSLVSAFNLYNSGTASKSKVIESHRRFVEEIEARNEEKLSRTQQLNTIKIQALRELGYKIVKITPNRMKPQYDVYWFEDSLEFRHSIPIAVEMAKK